MKLICILLFFLSIPLGEYQKEENYDPGMGLYDAYYQKYMELAEEYGPFMLIDKKHIAGHSYLDGVCIVNLMDFNGDGIEDLFVVYSNGEYTGVNMWDLPIFQGNSYTIEIWSYVDGKMALLMKQKSVSSFDTFKTAYWDSDDCFLTVYENSRGLPVIQLYKEQGEYPYFINLYYEEGKVKKDIFFYQSDLFRKNLHTVSQEEWIEELCGYHKILMGTYLSSNQYLSLFLEKYGISLEADLKRTRTVVNALSQSKSARFPIADNSYISIYLKELMQIRIEENKQYQKYEMEAEIKYRLFDLDQNGIPELILRTGDCEAVYRYHIYTIFDGEIQKCGEFSGGHSALSVGKEKGMICYMGHMGVYSITKWDLKGAEIRIEKIDEGETKESYPELEEYGYGNYDNSFFMWEGKTPILFYTYETEGA